MGQSDWLNLVIGPLKYIVSILDLKLVSKPYS